jgi:DNA-binding NarL/FixJ family response regulator
MPTAVVDAPLVADDTDPPVTRVLVFARDPISRAGVAGQVVGVSGMEVIEAGDSRPPDVAVVVTDVMDEEVFRVVRAIRRGSRSHVVVVAGVIDTSSMLTALEAGASGFLRRSLADREHLSHLIDKASRGETVLPPRIGERPLDQDDGNHESGGLTQSLTQSPALSQGITRKLSARDLEVLRLLADGCDTTEIAQRLAYSEPTIKNVIQRLFERLQVRNRPHAVAVALKTGII